MKKIIISLIAAIQILLVSNTVFGCQVCGYESYSSKNGGCGCLYCSPVTVHGLLNSLHDAVLSNNTEDMRRILARLRESGFSQIEGERLERLLLNSSLTSSKFLEEVLFSCGQIKDLGLEILVRIALIKGADPNNDKIIMTSIVGVCSPKILEVLFNNGYKKINPTEFLRSLERIDRQVVGGKHYHEVYGISYLIKNPSLVMDLRYKNLNAKAAHSPKIPRILHNVWLRPPGFPGEICKEDMDHVLRTHKLFKQTGQRWQHIVWTNDKRLFPRSVERLSRESNDGIQVRDISEVAEKLRLFKNVMALIEYKKPGEAVDALRYDIVNLMGGVSADLGFVFHRTLERDICTYDFFNQGGEFGACSGGGGFENDFFAARPDLLF